MSGVNQMINSIRKKIICEEFDYQTLLDQLHEYAYPRDKITALMQKGWIIRVKKGLYIFGDEYRNKPFSKGLLANLIFGPSYLSAEYALGYYGLIPEQVESVTSVTTGRSREFQTPVGRFVYRRIPLAGFRVGMDRVEIDERRSFLIALPEKAVADKIYLDRGAGIANIKELRTYLEDNLRMDMAELQKLDHQLLTQIAERFRSRKIRLLGKLVNRLK